MNDETHPAPPDWYTSLPEDIRDAYVAALTTFAHDLRQPLGQIYSAEELIRRGLNAGQGASELIELLDVIREANRMASMSVDAFVSAILDGVDPSDSSSI